MLGLSAVPAGLQVLGMLYVPTSPQYHILRKRKTLAEQILTKIYSGSPNPAAEARSQIETICAEQQQRGSYLDLFQPGVRMALLSGCGLQFFQQFIGINTVMYYSAIILESEGIQGNAAIYWYCPIAFLNFILTFPALLAIDSFGRRPLAVVSLCGCFISCMIMATAEWVHLAILSMISLAMYITSYAPGMGPVPLIVNSEIYPLELRSLGSSVGTSVNCICNIIVSQSFPVLMAVIGTGTTFLLLAGFCIAAIVFVLIFVPETKGLSMTEIGGLFETSSNYEPILDTKETRDDTKKRTKWMSV